MVLCGGGGGGGGRGAGGRWLWWVVSLLPYSGKGKWHNELFPIFGRLEL